MAEWGVQFIDGQWELSIRVVDDGLRVSIIDGPDQAGITLPMGSAIDLAHFFAAWRAAAERA